MKMNIASSMKNIPNSGVKNLYHFPRGTLAIPQSIAQLAVGQIRLENPSPNWYASTATCLFTSVRSASGTIIGIMAVACPEPDGMKKLIMFWITSIISAVAHVGSPSMRELIA